MVAIIAVRGDITEQRVDALVNAANTTMRGGGGVDGAIHRAGGPAVLADCIARFPHGLRTGDAGWTTAGNMPARWVIHTVGPNFRAGKRDRALLESCYRRSLEIADELGARTVAFPLISAGVYGWPIDDAIDVAVSTITATPTKVREARIVVLDADVLRKVQARISELPGSWLQHGLGINDVPDDVVPHWAGLAPNDAATTAEATSPRHAAAPAFVSSQPAVHTAPDSADLQVIREGLNVLRSGYVVEWSTGYTDEKGFSHLPYPQYDERVFAALQSAMRVSGSDREYLLHIDAIREHPIEEASMTDLATWVTYVMRGERFCDGFIAGFVEDGRLHKMLERLLVLVD